MMLLQIEHDGLPVVQGYYLKDSDEGLNEVVERADAKLNIGVVVVVV